MIRHLAPRLSVSFLAASAVFSALFPIVARAQPPAGQAVPPASPESGAASATGAPTGTAPTNGAAQTLTVPGKNLMSQRLHPASFPKEAEVRCSILEHCAFGLTRGFVLGSDVFSTGVTSLLGQQIYAPGAWIFYDAFAGFQFLQGVDDKFYANGSVGYRGFSYRKEIGVDQDEVRVRSSGFTFRVTYAQEITPIFSQGLTFNLFAGKTRMDDSGALSVVSEGKAHRKLVREFYDFSQQSPKVRLGLPADFEIINWKASHVDLPNHLRGYIRAEPFYIQNEFVIEDRASYIEKNFGVRTQYMMSYESLAQKSGRYAFLGGVGFDLATTNKPDIAYDAVPGDPHPALINEQPNHRKVLGLVLNLEGSYQF